MKVLLLEDDPMLQEILTEHLHSLGHSVTAVEDGIDAEEEALASAFDLWIFDINVPSQSGIELLEGLRRVNTSTPAIFITAKTDADSVSQAFNTGADDYLKKPFDLIELDARIGYIQKQLGLDREFIQLSRDDVLYLKERIAVIGGQEHHLSHKETKLLHFMATHKTRIHSHESLVAVVWETLEAPTDNALRTYIKKLRQILGKEAITTIHGEGYRFDY